MSLGLHSPELSVVLGLLKGDVLKVLKNPCLVNPSFFDHFKGGSEKHLTYIRKQLEFSLFNDDDKPFTFIIR